MVASRTVTCVAGAALAAASALFFWTMRAPATDERRPVMAAVVRPTVSELAPKALPETAPRVPLVEHDRPRYDNGRRPQRYRHRSRRPPSPYWYGQRGWRSYGYRDGYRRDGWKGRWSGRRSRPRSYAAPRYRDRDRLPYPAWLDEHKKPIWVRFEDTPPG